MKYILSYNFYKYDCDMKVKPTTWEINTLWFRFFLGHFIEQTIKAAVSYKC